MIGFGELRSRSAQWQTELSTVEKLYSLDWLLKGVFDRPQLSAALVLRGSSALDKAYFGPGAQVGDYPPVQDLEFVRNGDISDEQLEKELEMAAETAADASGLKFRLHSFGPSEARVEFTGPLGRRSAAQPLIVMRFFSARLRLSRASSPLLHPFSDRCEALVRAVVLEELAAERIVLYGQKPRARDVFDLWFILAHAPENWDAQKVVALAHEIARDKRIVLHRRLDSVHAQRLERAWDTALEELKARPRFAEAVNLIESKLSWIAE